MCSIHLLVRNNYIEIKLIDWECLYAEDKYYQSIISALTDKNKAFIMINEIVLNKFQVKYVKRLDDNSNFVIDCFNNLTAKKVSSWKKFLKIIADFKEKTGTDPKESQVEFFFNSLNSSEW
jgi:hypothetical protein